jgi:hypothetical protein
MGLTPDTVLHASLVFFERHRSFYGASVGAQHRMFITEGVRSCQTKHRHHAVGAFSGTFCGVQCLSINYK